MNPLPGVGFELVFLLLDAALGFPDAVTSPFHMIARLGKLPLAKLAIKSAGWSRLRKSHTTSFLQLTPQLCLTPSPTRCQQSLHMAGHSWFLPLTNNPRNKPNTAQKEAHDMPQRAQSVGVEIEDQGESLDVYQPCFSQQFMLTVSEQMTMISGMMLPPQKGSPVPSRRARTPTQTTASCRSNRSRPKREPSCCSTVCLTFPLALDFNPTIAHRNPTNMAVPAIFGKDLPPCGPEVQVAYENVNTRLRKHWLAHRGHQPVVEVCNVVKEELVNQNFLFPAFTIKGVFKKRKPWRRENGMCEFTTASSRSYQQHLSLFYSGIEHVLIPYKSSNTSSAGLITSSTKQPRKPRLWKQ